MIFSINLRKSLCFILSFLFFLPLIKKSLFASGKNQSETFLSKFFGKTNKNPPLKTFSEDSLVNFQSENNELIKKAHGEFNKTALAIAIPICKNGKNTADLIQSLCAAIRRLNGCEAKIFFRIDGKSEEEKIKGRKKLRKKLNCNKYFKVRKKSKIFTNEIHLGLEKTKKILLRDMSWFLKRKDKEGKKAFFIFIAEDCIVHPHYFEYLLAAAILADMDCLNGFYCIRDFQENNKSPQNLCQKNIEFGKFSLIEHKSLYEKNNTNNWNSFSSLIRFYPNLIHNNRLKYQFPTNKRFFKELRKKGKENFRYGHLFISSGEVTCYADLVNKTMSENENDNALYFRRTKISHGQKNYFDKIKETMRKVVKFFHLHRFFE